ncbi:Arc family DNA-binding protein [Phaeobacter piscinae]|uniref:Arc family DNA-binding protein n=1 Tax=Phaeobacter piscinae TaxID=1580596 RepID=UPI000C99DF78|nr:Arc family DNA-binding protein [Phaeobacter piscinae]
MTQDDRVQYKFMMPVGLKSRIEQAAHDNHRSLSAEVVARLEDSFSDSAVSGGHGDITFTVQSPGIADREKTAETATAIAKIIDFMLKHGQENPEIADIFRAIAYDQIDLATPLDKD